jgi:hypothetical protein
MKECNAEGDWDNPQDEVEEKIKVLQIELAKVSSNEDKKILWGAIGLIVFIVLYKLLKFNAIVFVVTIPVVVIGGISVVIFKNIQKKKIILIKHGLKCSKCGHLPKFINASGLYYTQKCPKCSANLDI